MPKGFSPSMKCGNSTPFLESCYRNSSLSFNQARLDYARNRFDSVLLLLQKAQLHSPQKGNRISPQQLPDRKGMVAGTAEMSDPNVKICYRYDICRKIIWSLRQLSYIFGVIKETTLITSLAEQ